MKELKMHHKEMLFVAVAQSLIAVDVWAATLQERDETLESDSQFVAESDDPDPDPPFEEPALGFVVPIDLSPVDWFSSGSGGLVTLSPSHPTFGSCRLTANNVSWGEKIHMSVHPYSNDIPSISPSTSVSCPLFRGFDYNIEFCVDAEGTSGTFGTDPDFVHLYAFNTENNDYDVQTSLDGETCVSVPLVGPDLDDESNRYAGTAVLSLNVLPPSSSNRVDVLSVNITSQPK